MVFGVHCALVKSELPAPESRKTPFFSFTMLLTASATPEFGTSTMTSTLSTSNHCRAILTPTSGLLRWSPEITSIFQPLAVRPESSTAIWAASVEPGPPRSAYRPDWSDSAPILTILSWANAKLVAARLSAVPSKNDAAILVFIAVPSVNPSGCSDAEIGMQFVHIGLQFRVREAVDDLAVLNDVIAVRDGRGEPEILLDQKDGETLFLKARDGMADLLDDDRCETFGRFIQHQKPRAGAQDSSDRQHLL